jgi:histidinol-phosphate aminotransferase
MAVSRRSFMRTLGAGGAGLLVAEYLAGRGQEAFAATGRRLAAPRSRAAQIRIDSNQNPNGPAPAALEAIRAMFGEANRYPDDPDVQLREAIARAHRVKPQQVLLGCGSGEVLRYVTEAYVSPRRHLVTAAPTFEQPTRFATRVGAPVREVRVDANLRLDLDGMLREVPGAGLVFYCNPNNPTGAVHDANATRGFLRAVLDRSPETTILVDEAYFEYVDVTPWETMIPLAVRNPRIVVARTFSKVFGLAGMRVGYAVAHEDTIAKLETSRVPNGVNVLAAAAAMASLELGDHVRREVALNKAARDFTVKAFSEMGYPCQPTHTNFVMVDIRRDVKAFQTTCRERGVAVGRQFPPLNNHLRVSIGTMDEMERALPLVAASLRGTRTDGRK